jgi:hypothetical protein
MKKTTRQEQKQKKKKKENGHTSGLSGVEWLRLFAAVKLRMDSLFFDPLP